MTKYGQPVISRETRLLLITMLVSIAALWVLARIRFHERPGTSSVPVAVPPVLAQLRSETGFADLARAVADIRPAASAALFTTAAGTPALRIRQDAAVTLRPGRDDERIGEDRATGLAIVRTQAGEVPGLVPWVPRLLDYPRYLVAADVAAEHVMLRPVFISGLFPVTSPSWTGQLWVLPPSAAIAAGTFLFTTDGAFAGMAVEHRGRSAIVPATLLFETAAGLVRSENNEPGMLGIQVEPVSAAIALATGVRAGMVVTAVEREGPAADTLIPTDIVEAIDGQTIETEEQWMARTARLNAGDSVSLRVRRAGGVHDVQIVATAIAKAAEGEHESFLGLRMRTVPKVGSEVTGVQSGSSAGRAGIQVGDVITVAAGQTTPTPAHITRAFDALPAKGTLLLAVTRDAAHRVLVLQK